MTVFKGFLTLTKRNAGLGIMYFMIFIVIALMVANMSTDTGVESFTPTKLEVTIIDKDGGELAKALTKYLGEHHTLVSVPPDKASLQNALFNRNTTYILTIPNGFETDVMENDAKLSVSKVPDSTTGMYVDNQINSFLNSVRSLKNSGYSVADAVSLALEKDSVSTTVHVIDKNGNQGRQPQYAFYYQYYPYVILAVLCFIAGANIMAFRKKEIKRRMQCSALSMKKQNGELTLAYIAIGTLSWLLCVIISLIFYGREFITSTNFIWFIINSFFMMLVAMAISFFIGVLVNRDVVLTPVANVVSLGMSFLCGVFVSLDLISPKVQMISKFLPVYWYEKANTLLYSYKDLSGSHMQTYLSYLLIQFLFATALLAVSFLVTRIKRQED